MRLVHLIYQSFVLVCLFTVTSGYALASTNFQADSFDIYVGDVDGDGSIYDDIYLKAKEKILIIASDISIPIPFRDSESILISGADGSLQTWLADVDVSLLEPATFEQLFGDFNGDGIKDVLLKSIDASQQSLIVYGGPDAAPKAVYVFEYIEGEAVYSKTLVIKDINNDGKDDLEILDNNGSSVLAFANSNGQFSEGSAVATGSIVPGSLAGDFSVGNSGSANYNIPIAVPIGVAGMQPQLGFSYSSGSGNGLLGTGWSVSQSSVISRCNNSYVDRSLYQSNVNPVTLTSKDRFCLDGNPLVNVEGNVYVAENDDFSRITSGGNGLYEGPAYFKVEYKSGEIAYFGDYNNSPSALFDADGSFHISQISDRAGNTREYSYFEDTTTGEHRLTNIVYPGGEIVYHYEERNDKSYAWFAGNKIQSTKRLDKIESKVGTNIFRTYDLSYSYSPFRDTSRLNSIQECGSDGSCFYPTTFSWDEIRNQTFSDREMITGNAAANYFVDVDGDGFQDNFSMNEVRFNNGDGTFGEPVSTGISITNHKYLRILDMDGDGRIEFLIPDANSNDYYILKYTEDGFNYEKILTGRDGYNKNPVIADMDGDGLPDLIYVSSSKRKIKFNQSPEEWAIPGLTKHHPDYAPEREFSESYDTGYSDSGWKHSYAFDLEGDGKQEILYHHKSSGWKLLRVKYENDNSMVKNYQFSQEDLGISIPEDDRWSIELLDFNGDGLQDIMYFRSSHFYVNINNGTGFNQAVMIRDFSFDRTDMGSGTHGDYSKQFLQFDYDDDGKADILYSDVYDGASRLHIYRSTGSFECLSTGYGCFERIIDPAVIWYMNVSLEEHIVDLNNDGLNELLISSLDNNFAYHKREAGGLPTYLKTVTNGFGLKTHFSYGKVEATAENSDLYRIVDEPLLKGTSLISGPMNVVKRIVIDKDYGRDDYIDYSYENLVSQIGGVGSLGFKRVISNSNNRTKTITTYNHDWMNRKHGQVSNKQSYVNDSNVWKEVSRVDFRYVTDKYYGRAPFGSAYGNISHTYLSEKDEFVWSLSGALVRSNSTNMSYDTGLQRDTSVVSSGNLLTTNVTTTSGDESYSIITSSLYEADNHAIWSLGRVTSSEVTSFGTNRPLMTKQSAWEYNPDGTLFKEIIEPGDSALTLTTEYTYNSFGLREIAMSYGASGAARSVSTTYDSLGRYPVSVTNDVGTVYTSYHPVMGGKTSITELNGLKKYWTYDGFGRGKSSYNADGTFTTMEFKSIQPFTPKPLSKYHLSATEVVNHFPVYYIESTNQNNAWSKTYYDKFGKAFHTRSLDALGQEVRVDTEYTAYGETYRVSEPYFASDITATHWTTTESLDPLKRALSVKNQEGERVTYTYDGLTTIMTNEKGYSKTEVKGIDGKLKRVIDQALNEVTYVYDAVGNMTSMTDETAGSMTHIEYDKRGRKENMTDPNKGYWQYKYNAFGQLITQTDGMNVTTCQAYDSLGRMVKRIDRYTGSPADAANDCAANESNPETSSWYYDTAVNGLGKLHRVEGPNDYSETYSYDQFGRPISVIKVIHGETFVGKTTYDNQSRPVIATYPSGFEVKNKYNNYGGLVEVGNAANDEYYWQLKEIDHRGKPTRVSLAEGVMETQKTYTPARGFVESIVTSSFMNVGNLQFNYAEYDQLANVKYRRDDVNNSSEAAGYDQLNRLEYIDRTVSGIAQTRETMSYEHNGNIETKWDIAGDYEYAGTNYLNSSTCQGVTPGPHAVTGANNNTYCYDDNGNMLNGAGRNIIWGAFGKPIRIEKGTNVSVDFEYGPARNRIRRIDTNNSQVFNTTYVGSYEKKVEQSNGKVEERHYVGGFLVVNKTTDGASVEIKQNYLLKDNLGSVVTTINLAELVNSPNSYSASRTSFDAWGMRRNNDWSEMSLANLYDFKSSVTDRGFTGHEQIDEVGLIHMNGRLYDPVIGRFISADPIIQSPTDLQSLNRYTYVRNNPLTLIDPSGFSWWSKQWKKWAKDTVGYMTGIKILQKSLREFGRFARKNKYVAEITQVVGCIVTGPGCALVVAAVTYGVTDGDFQAALMAGAIAFAQTGISAGIGQMGAGASGMLGATGMVAAHGVSGGIFSEMRGGKFKNGFAAGAFGKAASLGLSGAGYGSLGLSDAGKGSTWEVAGRTAISAIVGGTASSLSGGKFANGAVTAAMQHLFNAETPKPTRVRLGIHSNVGSEADLTDGHAWLSLEGGSKKMTLGLWPDGHPATVDNGAGTDVRVGLEDGLASVSSKYFALNTDQLARLQTFVNTNATWGYTHTCADWARDAVQYSTGLRMDVDDWFGFETPRELSRSLGK
jgi:RHS repeat-associated protein